MLLEATTKRIRYRSLDGSEIVLPLGVPIEVEDRCAAEILARAKDKVRQVPDPYGSAEAGDVPMPGASVRWRRGDKSYGFGRVDQVLIDPADTPPIWVCLETGEGGFTWLNPRAVKLEVDQTTQEPLPPLSPGWLVAYRDSAGRLCGGCDDRARGTVKCCEWDGWTWRIMLTNGDALPIRQVVSVGKTDGEGRLVAAWLVNKHGYDGEGLHP